MVPEEHRKRVVELAQNVPFAGQLGISKTRLRLLWHSYWPRLVQDVLAPERGRQVRAPLQPPSVLGEFGRKVRGLLDLGWGQRKDSEG